MSDEMRVLAPSDQKRLRELEDTVERGLETFVEVGQALMEIRDGELWKAYDVSSFTDYLEHRWDMGVSRGYQLMSAAQVVENVSTNVESPPKNEAQARPLTKLPEEEQAEAWEEAVETAPEKNGEKRVTASHVEETVERRRGDRTPGDRDSRSVASEPTTEGGDQDTDDARPLNEVANRTPYPEKLRRFIAAASRLGTPSDDEIEAIPTNLMMLDNLKRARTVIDRILSHHGGSE